MDPADCVISVLSLNSIRSKSFRSVRVKPLHLQSSPGRQKRARYLPGGRPGDRALCTHQRPPAPKGSSGSFPGTSCAGAAWSPARGPALPSGGRHHCEQRPRRAAPLSPALSAAGVFRPNACCSGAAAPALAPHAPPCHPLGANALEQGGLSPAARGSLYTHLRCESSKRRRFL